LLDEIIIAGHIQESSKKVVLKAVAGQESLIDENGDDKRKN